MADLLTENVLKALREYFRESPDGQIRPDDVELVAGVPKDQVNRVLGELLNANPPYIEGIEPEEMTYPAVITGLTERGRA